MMNFRRSDLIGLRQEIVHPRGNLKLEEVGKREDSILAKVRGEKHIDKEKKCRATKIYPTIF
jgi:hypothetical protein